jgi:PEP-CTERM/exosortase A-associated glycosyltransferase
MTLRVLHVLDHSVPLQSGYAFRTLSLLREQRALGWETFHLTTPKHYAPSGAEQDVNGFHFYRTPAPPNALRRAPLIKLAMVVRDTAKRLREVIERVTPHIIHAHSPCLNGLAALRVAADYGIPLVYEMRASWEDAAVDHGTTSYNSIRYRLSRALETYVLKRADAITTICEGLASDIVVRGIERDRITVVPNAVDAAEFRPLEGKDQALHESLGLQRGPVLGFVGSFYAYEGLDLLIRALPVVLAERADAQVLFVGGGPAEAELKELAKNSGVDSHMRFAGRVPHDDVGRYYSLIDLLVYPRKSLRLTELVTPLKPLEAMAVGRPFIASEVAGHRELIPAHLRACWFEAGDAGALAQSVLAALRAESGWPALIAAGRKYVTDDCTWQRSVSRYREVYSAVLEGAGVGGCDAIA